MCLFFPKKTQPTEPSIIIPKFQNNDYMLGSSFSQIISSKKLWIEAFFWGGGTVSFGLPHIPYVATKV